MEVVGEGQCRVAAAATTSQRRLTGEKGTVKTWAPPGRMMRRSSCSAWYGRGTREKICGQSGRGA